MNYQEFVNGFKTGEQHTVSWSWKNDNWRQKMNRLSKKGYFKKRSIAGDDFYTRTAKEWVDGDGINKPIQFSKTITTKP